MTKLSPSKIARCYDGNVVFSKCLWSICCWNFGAGMSIANENATKTEKLIAYTDGYQQLAIYALVAGLVLIAISPVVRKLMQEVK